MPKSRRRRDRRGRVRELASRWVRAESYPRASSHAEEEEFEDSTHARGTRAGTKAGESLGEGGIVPACVLARGGRGILKIPLTPAGRGRVRKRVSCWVRAESYPRASPHAEEEEFEDSTHARGTRAGTKAGELLGEGCIVPACVPARGGRGILKIPLTPAGRGRVRVGCADPV